MASSCTYRHGYHHHCTTWPGPIPPPPPPPPPQVPTDPSQLRAQTYYCRSCSSYLPSTEFELSSNSHTVGHCRSCRSLDNKAREREDHSTFRSMLRQIRTSEERFADGSRVVFLMQVSGETGEGHGVGGGGGGGGHGETERTRMQY